jgi:hypothetical protein
MLLRPLCWLLLARFLRLVLKFFNSSLSLVTSTTRIASSTILPPMYLRVTLGWSWHSPQCMATLWPCTNAPTFPKFKGLILLPLSVLSQRFPQPFLARGHCLLSEASNLAPAAVDQPPLFTNPPLLVAPLAGEQRFMIYMAPLTSIKA